MDNMKWVIKVINTTPPGFDMGRPPVELHTIDATGSPEFVDGLCRYLKDLYQSGVKINRYRLVEKTEDYWPDWPH